MKLNIELPINQTSFGQFTFGFLYEVFKRQLLPNIFPIGEVNVGVFEIEKPFVDWLQFCIQKAPNSFSRKYPTIRMWHLMGSEHRISDYQILWTPHETDVFTGTEKNIIKNIDKVYFPSKFSVEHAKKAGLENIEYCPNFFDHLHVSKINNIAKPDAISFSLIGKFEKRKNTAAILQLWAKLFGNNKDYRLNCLINNMFINQEHWPQIINQVFNGNIPWNINFLPFQEKNTQVNLIMNACDIDLSGLSGAEGFNLPCFNMLALDKIGVVLEAHAHLDYMYDGNSVVVPIKDKTPIYDGQFFIQGAQFNQGNMFIFDPDVVATKINEAVQKHINQDIKQTELSKKFGVSNIVDTLFSTIS